MTQWMPGASPICASRSQRMTCWMQLGKLWPNRRRYKNNAGSSRLSWVIRVGLTLSPLLPVYPNELTSRDRPGMSGWCQWATSHAWFDMKEAAH